MAVTDERRIAGCYTLAAASLLLADLPPGAAKKFPLLPDRAGCASEPLGRGPSAHGARAGRALLADALHREVRAEIAAYALLVACANEPGWNDGASTQSMRGCICHANVSFSILVDCAS